MLLLGFRCLTITNGARNRITCRLTQFLIMCKSIRLLIHTVCKDYNFDILEFGALA